MVQHGEAGAGANPARRNTIINLLYVFFIFLLSAYYLSISGPLGPLFDLLGVPVGNRTFVVEGMMLIVCSAIFAISRSKAMIARQLFRLSLAWVPFILFMIFRCDFGDPYSLKKLGLMIVAQFMTLIFVCVAYVNDPDRFDMHFYPWTIVIASLLFVYLLANPSKFEYVGVVERLSLETINPIWLARSFATGALCLLLLGKGPKWLIYAGCGLFIPGIILTGSRGPLLSLLLTVALFWIWRGLKSRSALITGIVLICVILPVAVIVLDQYQPTLDRYFQRGSKKTMFVQSGRFDGVTIALREFSSAPLLGRGLGKYGEVEGIRIKSFTNKQVVQAVYPHNVPAEVLAELGLCGFALFLIALRPGKWMSNLSNRYVFLFVLSLLFSLSSGDITGNSGLFIFGLISRLASESYGQ